MDNVNREMEILRIKKKFQRSRTVREESDLIDLLVDWTQTKKESLSLMTCQKKLLKLKSKGKKKD